MFELIINTQIDVTLVAVVLTNYSGHKPAQLRGKFYFWFCSCLSAMNSEIVNVSIRCNSGMMNSRFLGTGLKQKLPKKAKVTQKKDKKQTWTECDFFPWQISYTDYPVWLTLNTEGFIGLSSCFHSSIYENHMFKGKKIINTKSRFLLPSTRTMHTHNSRWIHYWRFPNYFLVFKCSADTFIAVCPWLLWAQ